MFIVSSFRLIHNEKTGVPAIVSDEAVPCPLCKGRLFYRNSRLRKLMDLAGDISKFLLRRFVCERCKKLHTEIPCIIQPYKHYDSETIQGVLDGGEGAKSCCADDSTIRRWRSDFAKEEADITQRLLSVFAAASDEKPPIRASGQVFHGIRALRERWLAFVMALLINHGHKLCTRFAFCPFPSAARVNAKGKLTEGGDKTHDETIDDSG